MMVTDALKRYQELKIELDAVREANHDQESEREDEILDAMDYLWWEMSDEGRAFINAECSARVNAPGKSTETE